MKTIFPKIIKATLILLLSFKLHAIQLKNNQGRELENEYNVCKVKETTIERVECLKKVWSNGWVFNLRYTPYYYLELTQNIQNIVATPSSVNTSNPTETTEPTNNVSDSDASRDVRR